MARALAFVVVLSAGLCGCPAPDDDAPLETDAIRIGAYFPDTGDNAAGGRMTKEGIDLARALRPRVLDRDVEVVYVDNRSDKAESANAVSRLIDKERVLAVMGTYASSNAIAGAEVCEADRVPMLAASATNPMVTAGKEYSFRACFIDPYQGRVLAKYAVEELGAESALVVRDVANDYSVGLASFFRVAFEEFAGPGSVRKVLSYQKGDQDFTAQITVAKSEGVDVICIPGYFADIALLARQARELGVGARLLAGDAAQADELISIGGEAVEGLVLSNHYAPEESTEGPGKAFVDAFREEYGKEPNAFGALGFDSYNLLLDAMERIGRSPQELGLRPFREALRNELALTRDFPGVTGTITIDENGDARKSAVILEVRDGKFTYVTTVPP